MTLSSNRLWSILTPVISVAVFLVLWDRAVVWFEVPKYLIPRPLDVAAALWRGGILSGRQARSMLCGCFTNYSRRVAQVWPQLLQRAMLSIPLC